MDTNRIDWIDRMKAVCILFVLMAHLDCGKAVPQRLYMPFFLNGFLFTAGWVHRQEAFFVFFRKKVRKLLIPWLVFSVGNLILSRLLSFQQHGDFWVELGWNLLQVRGQGDGVWFVAALWVAFFSFYLLIAWHQRHGKDGHLLLFAAVLWSLGQLYEARMDPALLPWNSKALPWHLEYIPHALFFMVLGWLCRQRGREISRWWMAAFGVLLLPGIRIPEPVSGTIGVLALASFCNWLPPCRVLSCIGRNTLVCFALHGKVMSLLEWVLGHAGWYSHALKDPLLSALLAAALAVGMALVLLIPSGIIDRWLPWLLGKEGRKHP